MAIWIPILLIIGGAALMGVGILADIKGYKLAVLGARRVGKTVLIKFLTTGTLSKGYVKTGRPKKTDSRRFKLKNLNLKIEESVDSPGSDILLFSMGKYYQRCRYRAVSSEGGFIDERR